MSQDSDLENPSIHCREAFSEKIGTINEGVNSVEV